MVNPRQKGATCESVVQKKLIEATGLEFERTPASGAGKIKGDLYLPKQNGRYCIEIKHYAESHFNDKIFTSKTNNIVLWWTKIVLQAKQMNKKPLLIFKYNRSKFFVCTDQKPAKSEKFVDIRWLNCYTMLLDDWLESESIQWLN
jgi:Holliday junction resolvase